jgi:hypothetical protein
LSLLQSVGHLCLYQLLRYCLFSVPATVEHTHAIPWSAPPFRQLASGSLGFRLARCDAHRHGLHRRIPAMTPIATNQKTIPGVRKKTVATTMRKQSPARRMTSAIPLSPSLRLFRAHWHLPSDRFDAFPHLGPPGLYQTSDDRGPDQGRHKEHDDDPDDGGNYRLRFHGLPPSLDDSCDVRSGLCQPSCSVSVAALLEAT